MNGGKTDLLEMFPTLVSQHWIFDRLILQLTQANQEGEQR